MLLKLFQLLFVIGCEATTLSYRMQPHERACFFTEVKRISEKIGFYFAVQEGGNFDVDFEIIDPESKITFSGITERQGDYVFASKLQGEYSFCFSNTMSTFTEKVIDFDITVEHDVHPIGYIKSELVKAVGKTVEAKQEGIKKTPMQDLLSMTSNQLVNSVAAISRQQRVLRTKEHRNTSIIGSTESRIVWFALLESLLVAALSVAQVYMIRTFFAKSGRTRV
jgi:hypothetical protein